MKARCAVGAAILCCSGSIAQAVTATAVAADRPVSCTGGPTNSIVPGTILNGGGTVTTQGATSFGSGHATTTFAPLSVDPYEVQASLRTDVAVTTTMWFATFAAACGYLTPDPVHIFNVHNDVIVTLQAAAPVRGRLVVSYTGATSTFDTLYAVDVGDDGTLDAGTVLYPPAPPPVIAFGPGVLPIRLGNYTHRSLYELPDSIAASTNLTVRLVPDSGCTSLMVTPPCGSVGLSPRQNFTLGIDQQLQGLLPPGRGVAGVVYGFTPASTPLPLPPGCTLGTGADEVRLVFADGSGHAIHSIRTVPLSLRPCLFFAQAFELDLAAATLVASATYRIDCR